MYEASATFNASAPADHWLFGEVASPAAVYPEFAERHSFGLHKSGSVVVEVVDDLNNVGVGISTGGRATAAIIADHMAPLLLGAPVGGVERTWDVLRRATMHLGTKGIVANALSACDLAQWDLWGHAKSEPVFALLGGPIRRELRFYGTGPDPARIKDLGFHGGKIPLRHGLGKGRAGQAANADRLAASRDAVGSGFPLSVDCWMSQTYDTAAQLMGTAAELAFTWVEEPLPPDDYWGYQRLRKERPPGVLLAAGEHEAGLRGFRLLLEMQCADVIQPDIMWCGGMTELRRIAALADSYGVAVVPHGSSNYTNHFLSARVEDYPNEFILVGATGSEILPTLAPALVGETVPADGHLTVGETPGFGVDLQHDACTLFASVKAPN